MTEPFTPAELERLHALWRAIISERRTRLLGPWLVLVQDDWSVTLEVARRWVVGHPTRHSPLSGWFAGRLEDAP